MIKCPKCDFEQPEDIYCANCGVNMKNYHVSVPLFKRVISSWITIVAALIVVIIAVVMYDKQRVRKKAEPVYVSQNARNQYIKTGSDYDTAAPEPVRPTAQAARKAAPAAASMEASTAPAVPRATDDKSKKKSEVVPTKPILRISFYEASRNAIQEIQRDSSGGNISGDGSTGILPQNKIQNLVSSGELKSVSSNRYKDFDPQHPIVIFKGQRSAEAAKNIGLYFQITPLRQDSTSLQLEIKSWGNVKLQDNDENFFTSEMTLNPQSSAFIAGFLPKDKTFTDDEKTIFESDRTLKIYNQDEFLDGAIDLIMVVEMTTAP